MISLPVLVLLPQPVTVNLTTYCTALMAWRPLIRWTLLCLFSSPLIHNANTSIKPDKSALQQLYNKLVCLLLEQLNAQFHKDSPAQRGHCTKISACSRAHKEHHRRLNIVWSFPHICENPRGSVRTCTHSPSSHFKPSAHTDVTQTHTPPTLSSALWGKDILCVYGCVCVSVLKPEWNKNAYH